MSRFNGHRPPSSHFRRLLVETLESRQMLCADELAGHAILDGASELGTFPAILGSANAGENGAATFQSNRIPVGPMQLAVGQAGGATGGAQGGAVGSLSVPAYSSLPTAADALFLDFNGDFTSSWGSYSNITTPVYDTDGDPTTFSSGELLNIQQVWAQVAEDYAPFNINVTTVEPASFANGVGLRIDIGGNGSWAGGTYGGISYVGSFTNSIANVAFVFPNNLGAGAPRYVGEASSHEAGHAFGLNHQSTYDSSGAKTNEYNPGSGDSAPIMGVSYYATRGLWWYGTSTSSTTYQDDLAVISQSANTFGYRPDDVGNNASSATPLILSGTQVSGAGIIGKTNDVDYFSFATDSGAISLRVDVPAGINNLDARLELRDAGGNLLASADPTDSYGASLNYVIATGESYRVVVGSHGNYGDLGQYIVSGTIVPQADTGMAAPTNLTAIASGNLVHLQWTDNATKEISYLVQRSSDGGVTWGNLATLAADSTSDDDGSVTAGSTYSYRVQAIGSGVVSDFSNIATVALRPDAPLGLTATAVSASRIDLSWSDVAGETSYKIDRSADGVNWSQVTTTAQNVTTYQDLGLIASTSYSYRVRATNAGGDSDYSNLAVTTTLAAPTPPAAPSGLTAAATSQQVTLSWIDNSANETGFVIERASSNGSGTYSIIATVGANMTSFVDNSVAPGKTYTYRIRAVNNGVYSDYSNVATITTPKRSGR